MNYKIRKMKKEDIKEVQDVAWKSWKATYNGIIPAEIQQNFLKVAYSDEMMEHRLNQSLILVAEADGRVVGFANYSRVNDAGVVELSAIYIYPDYQGIGIGTSLLKKGIKHLEAAKEIYVNVEKENEIGKNFYQANGFKLVETFDDDFDGHILKTLRMVLEI